MLIRIYQTIRLQIVCKTILDSKDIVKSITDPDDSFTSRSNCIVKYFTLLTATNGIQVVQIHSLLQHSTINKEKTIRKRKLECCRMHSSRDFEEMGCGGTGPNAGILSKMHLCFKCCYLWYCWWRTDWYPLLLNCISITLTYAHGKCLYHNVKLLFVWYIIMMMRDENK